MIPLKSLASLLLAIPLLAGAQALQAADAHVAAEHAPPAGPAFTGFGPETPRDIDSKKGENKRVIAKAPPYKQMNLCNIHVHTHAEHKAKAYSILAKADDNGHGGGYQCNISEKLSKEELTPPAENFCKDMKPGDTVEVHWTAPAT